MKHFTTLLALLLSCSMLGQFIPQPMGYNPDANGDSFIGVDDVMGTLSVYNSFFANNDSLELGFFEFPQDLNYQTSETDGVGDFSVGDSLDLVYLVQNDYSFVHIHLPSGNTWKVLQIFYRVEGISNCTFQFISDTGPIGSNWSYVNTDNPRYFTLIRGHDGHWYFPDDGINY